MLNLALPLIVQQLLPLLKIVGLDPCKLAKKMSREAIQIRMDAAVPYVVADLEKVGLTPDVKATNPEGERLMIKSAMFTLGKKAMPFRKGAGHAADLLRDRHLDQVVARAGAEIEVHTPTDRAVRIIMRHYLERLF